MRPRRTDRSCPMASQQIRYQRNSGSRSDSTFPPRLRRLSTIRRANSARNICRYESRTRIRVLRSAQALLSRFARASERQRLTVVPCGHTPRKSLGHWARRIRVKGGGQECPPHRFPGSPHVLIFSLTKTLNKNVSCIFSRDGPVLGEPELGRLIPENRYVPLCPIQRLKSSVVYRKSKSPLLAKAARNGAPRVVAGAFIHLAEVPMQTARRRCWSAGIGDRQADR